MTEFGLIEHIKELFKSVPDHNVEGIGDDCAVIPMGDDSLLITSDMLVEDVHFLRAATSAYELGYKSLAVNLSDVAAMGARPFASMLSLSIPVELMGEWMEEFMRGYHALSERYGVALIGGDTTASKGVLSINVTAIGRAKNSNIKRRSAAEVGDVIMVSGELGESGRGLADIFAGDYNSSWALKHKMPEPHVDYGEWLGAEPAVHAMMDISDGVASDLRHILKCSSVGARVSTELIPTQVDLKTAICAGEDYKLLLTVDSSEAEMLMQRFKECFNSPLYVIGEITDSQRMEWYAEGVLLEDVYSGFRHY